MSDLFAPSGKMPSGYDPYHTEKSALQATSVDAELRRLEQEDERIRQRTRAGRLAVFTLRRLKREITDEVVEVDLAKSRAERALAIVRGKPEPASSILDSEDVLDEDERVVHVGEVVSKFNIKLHDQMGPGILEQRETRPWDENVRHGYCVLCRTSIDSSSTTLIGFQEPRDMTLDDTDKLAVTTSENPRGEVVTVSYTNAEYHGLAAHPLLAQSQDIADRLLALEPYVNPDFDGEPDVTPQLGELIGS